jgi:hypothetical protein
MKWLGLAAEFGLVAAIGLTLTVQATGAGQGGPDSPAPSASDVVAAAAFAERQAERVNGR